MVLLPISYYPAPSDDKNQIQVLKERKSELTVQQQDVSQSNLGEQQKQQIIGGIQEKIDAADGEIQYRRSREAAKSRADETRLTEKSIRNKQEEISRQEQKRADNAGLPGGNADKQAKAIKNRLDIKA